VKAVRLRRVRRKAAPDQDTRTLSNPRCRRGDQACCARRNCLCSCSAGPAGTGPCRMLPLGRRARHPRPIARCDHARSAGPDTPRTARAGPAPALPGRCHDRARLLAPPIRAVPASASFQFTRGRAKGSYRRPRGLCRGSRHGPGDGPESAPRMDRWGHAVPSTEPTAGPTAPDAAPGMHRAKDPIARGG
jgi:hypothetical protein